MNFDEPLKINDVIEGRVFPAQGRDDPEAVVYRLTRMMQRGVLIGFDDPALDLVDRTMLFIDRFGDSVDRYPKVVNLLLNPPITETVST